MIAAVPPAVASPFDSPSGESDGGTIGGVSDIYYSSPPADEGTSANKGPRNPSSPGSAPGEPVPLDGGTTALLLAGFGLGVYMLRRRAVLAAVALVSVGPAMAQGAVLSPGDIIVTSFYTSYGGSGGGDAMSFVTMVDLPVGTTFKITDAGWNGSALVQDAPGAATSAEPGPSVPAIYRAPCNVPAGTLFRFAFNSPVSTRQSTYTCPGNGSPASRNAATGFTSGNFPALSGEGDQAIIYQDAATTGNTTGEGNQYQRFVYAVTTRGTFVAASGAITDNTTKLPPLLDIGSTAVELPTANTAFNGVYRGVNNGPTVTPPPALRVGSRGQLLLRVGDVSANWTGNNVNANSGPDFGPNYLRRVEITAFTVAGDATDGTATAVGGVGWRNLSPPGATVTVASLVNARAGGINWIQGLEDEHPTATDGRPLLPNLFFGYNGDNDDDRQYQAIRQTESGFRSNLEGFVPPRNESVALAPGKGILWYFYDQAAGANAAPNGTTVSRVLPVLFPAIGTVINADVPVTFTVAERTSARDNLADRVFENGFYFLGNPFQQAFDLSGVVATGGTLQQAFTFWNPNAGGPQVDAGNGTPGSYVVRNVITTDTPAANVYGDDVQVWQGFFGEITGAALNTPASFTLRANARVPNARPTFYGRPAGTPPATVALQLSGETADGPTFDQAGQFYFNDAGTDGWDPYDLSDLGSLSGTAAMLRPLGVGPEGQDGYPLMQHSLPVDLAGSLELPVQLVVSGVGGSYTVTWALEDLPETWTLTLTDQVAGATVDLRTATSYAFDAEVGVWDRFVMTASAAATAGETGTTRASLALTPTAPNPTSGVSRVTVSGLTDAAAEVAVYDALGRRVAVLHTGAAPGGRASLGVDASALAPGVYTIRAASSGEMVSTRLVVVR